MTAEPFSIGENRNPDGTFAVGNPGGPGRPTGSVSIVAKIKRKFEDDPEYFDEWVSKLMEDPANRKAILEQIDGKPKQAMDITSAGKAIAGFNFLRNGDTHTDNTADALSKNWRGRSCKISRQGFFYLAVVPVAARRGCTANGF